MAGLRWAGIAAVVLVACTAPADCSTAGCPFGHDAGVVVHVTGESPSGGAEIEVCVDGDCDLAVRDIEQSDPAGGVLVYILPGADEGSEVVVSLTRPLVDAAVGTATLESSRPNGPRCSPTCTYAEVFLAAG